MGYSKIKQDYLFALTQKINEMRIIKSHLRKQNGEEEGK